MARRNESRRGRSERSGLFCRPRSATKAGIAAGLMVHEPGLGWAATRTLTLRTNRRPSRNCPTCRSLTFKRSERPERPTQAPNRLALCLARKTAIRGNRWPRLAERPGQKRASEPPLPNRLSQARDRTWPPMAERGRRLAERPGFEPGVPKGYTRFPTEPIRPLWHLSVRQHLGRIAGPGVEPARHTGSISSRSRGVKAAGGRRTRAARSPPERSVTRWPRRLPAGLTRPPAPPPLTSFPPSPRRP